MRVAHQKALLLVCKAAVKAARKKLRQLEQELPLLRQKLKAAARKADKAMMRKATGPTSAYSIYQKSRMKERFDSASAKCAQDWKQMASSEKQPFLEGAAANKEKRTQLA